MATPEPHRELLLEGVAQLPQVARGEERPDSDLDLVVRFEKPRGLLAIVRLERELSEALGRKVDLLTEGAISPYIRVRIQDDLRVVYEEG